jgi:hypothetical protein
MQHRNSEPAGSPVGALTQPGQTIPYTSPDGRISITVQYVTAGVYTITTYQGTLRLDSRCRTVDNEAEARDIARGYAVLAGTGLPAEQVTA